MATKRYVFGDSLAYTAEIVKLSIPPNTASGSSVLALIRTALGLGGANPAYYARIVSWELKRNAADFQVSTAATMPDLSTLTVPSGEGLALPLSLYALSTLYLRSTSASTVDVWAVIYLCGPHDEVQWEG